MKLEFFERRGKEMEVKRIRKTRLLNNKARLTPKSTI